MQPTAWASGATFSLCTPSTRKGFSLHPEAPLLLRSPSTLLGHFAAWLGLRLAAPMTLSPLLGVQYAGSRCGRVPILLLKQAVATLRTPHHANPVQGDWVCGRLPLLGKNNCYHLFSHLKAKAKPKTTTTTKNIPGKFPWNGFSTVLSQATWLNIT